MGDLFDHQWSPKVALVFSPTVNHAFRVTYNQAFQTPNYSEFFLNTDVKAPANFLPLEGALRASPLGPALAGVPSGQLFTNSSAVPDQGPWQRQPQGREDQELGARLQGGAQRQDLRHCRLLHQQRQGFRDRPAAGRQSTVSRTGPPPAEVPDAYKAALVAAVAANLAPTQPLAAAGLTRLEDGSTAVVVSYTNAGNVDLHGLDFGIGYQLTDEFRVDGTYSMFDFTVKSQQLGDQLLPNTPKHKETLTFAYEGMTNGFDANISGRFVPKYKWAAGVFVGEVPSSESISASVGYQFTPRYRFSVNGTNIFDQQRYQLFGGSLIGRRVLAGLTARF